MHASVLRLVCRRIDGSVSAESEAACTHRQVVASRLGVDESVLPIHEARPDQDSGQHGVVRLVVEANVADGEDAAIGQRGGGELERHVHQAAAERGCTRCGARTTTQYQDE